MKISPFVTICLLLFSCTPTYHTTVVTTPNPGETQMSPPPPSNQEVVSYQEFYDELSPYGNWIDYPGEGYVWSPNVDPNFQPYATNGNWVYTDEGWTWVSGYSWGWAPFHYGRWFYEDAYGWLWLPGHEWAPAWVTWGQSGNYYGWAPLAPHIDADAQWTPPSRAWTFVPAEHVSKPNVAQYAVDRSTSNTVVKNVTIINNTTTVVNKNVVNNTVVNNNITNNTTTNNVHNNTTNNTVNNHVTNNTTVINKGPDIKEVQKASVEPIQKVTVVENNKPSQSKTENNKLYLYRPVITEQATLKAGNKPVAPKKILPYNKPNPGNGN